MNQNDEDTLVNCAGIVLTNKSQAKDIDLSGIFRMNPEEILAALKEIEQ
jgi:hypothetical protein